jgi:hypothetical protein
MTKTDIIKQQCRSLKFAALSANLDIIIIKAEKEHFSYLDLINALMDSELQHRKEKGRERRTKHARLPLSYNLDLYDKSFQNGLDIKRFGAKYLSILIVKPDPSFLTDGSRVEPNIFAVLSESTIPGERNRIRSSQRDCAVHAHVFPH